MISVEKRRALFEDQGRWFDRMGNAHAAQASRRAAGRGRGRSGRAKGGIARAAALTPERRSEIARAAAVARWGNPRVSQEPA